MKHAFIAMNGYKGLDVKVSRVSAGVVTVVSVCLNPLPFPFR
jgi:hypothetical protein